MDGKHNRTDVLIQYRPIPFKPIKYFRAGGASRRFTIYWLLACFLIVPSGMLTRIFELTGLSITLLGLDLYITIYLPMLICLPMCLVFGYFWAAIPAYFSTVMVAILGDMPLQWIVVFAFANPIGLAMLILIYRTTPAKINLHDIPSVWFFVVASFLSSLSGSIGSFIWTYTNQVNLHDFFRVWQGWWLGGFIQALLICAPLLYVFASSLIQYKKMAFPEIAIHQEKRSTFKLAIILTTMVLILFTWLAFKVGMMNVKDQIDMLSEDSTRALILDALNVIEFPVIIYIFVLAFIGYFVFYFIDYWTLRLEQANTELTKHNDQLYQLSIRDNLTKAFNRGYLFHQMPELIEQAKVQQRALTVMVIDFDHFKKINDQYGHSAGDQVLKAFISEVQKILCEGQVFARFGGEEFVLATHQSASDEAKSLAIDLNELARQMVVHVNDDRIKFTISIGVFVTHDLGMMPDQMIDLADHALYQAKANGRDQYVMAVKT